MTIGQRCYLALNDRAERRGVSCAKECRKCNIEPHYLQYWRKGGNPSAKALKELALAGYDIYYILTGERK